MVTLAIRRTDADEPERLVGLDDSPVLIGRSTTCTICLTHRSVSRLHAELTRHDDGTWHITRAEAAQKVWVNGAAVDAAPLRGGETIRIGPYQMQFQLQGTAAVAANPPEPAGAADAQPEAAPPAMLVVEAGGASLGRVPLAGPVTLIGGSDECDVRLVDPACGPQQVAIHRVDDGFVLQILDAAADVILNGQRIASDTELAGGDVIEIGRARMSFVAADVEPDEAFTPVRAPRPVPRRRQNAFMKMASDWQRLPAFWQVGSAAALACAIVGLASISLTQARKQQRTASATPRQVAVKKPSAKEREPAAEEASPTPAPPAADRRPGARDAGRNRPAAGERSPRQRSAERSFAPDAGSEPDSPDEAERPAAPPRSSLEDLLEQAEQMPPQGAAPAQPAATPKSEARVSRSVAVERSTDTRTTLLAVPPKDEVAAALDRVQSLYADDFAQPGAITALLPKLIDAAQKSTKPANKYAILLAAEREAVKAASLPAAVAAVAARATIFEIDGLQERLDLLVEASKVKGALAADVLDLTVDVGHEALVEERFDIANRAATLSNTVADDIDQAAKARPAAPADPAAAAAAAMGPSTEPARRLRQLVNDTKRLHQKFEEALETLQKTPEDEKALEIVGKYRCFVRGDWERGLPALAACRDEPLRDLAKREVALDAARPDAVAVFAVAGEWWSFADGVKRSAGLPAETGTSARRHAADLYTKILANLEDPLDAKLASNRIAAVAEESTHRRPIGP